MKNDSYMQLQFPEQRLVRDGSTCWESSQVFFHMLVQTPSCCWLVIDKVIGRTLGSAKGTELLTSQNHRPQEWMDRLNYHSVSPLKRQLKTVFLGSSIEGKPHWSHPSSDPQDPHAAAIRRQKRLRQPRLLPFKNRTEDGWKPLRKWWFNRQWYGDFMDLELIYDS